MKRPNAWEQYNDQQLEELEDLSERYRDFISNNKTEREFCAEAIRLAEAAGYVNLADVVEAGAALAAGDRVYAVNRNKALLLAEIGTAPFARGTNILGAHIDSPRLDVKQNPLSESGELVTLDTHYYGGIKKYQWVTLPLAIHGVICRQDGSKITVNIGEDPEDPLFCISDLLPHLASEQMKKTAADAVEGELLDVIVGNRPLRTSNKNKKDAKNSSSDTESAVRDAILAIIKDHLEIDEEDLLSAELEVVPAGAARDLGFDRSMILGYGQDDRACAFPSLLAQLECSTPERTAITLLVDKEEIGSYGATGMRSNFFEDAMAEILELAGESGELALRRCLRSSRMLSSDVSAAFDPAWPQVFESKNACYLGHGLTINKYTGSRGKAGSNDADAEYMALVRRCLNEAGVSFQTAELGRVDAGGGGTIALIMARYGMSVIDSGVPVLSMHSPWEVTSKADIYEAYRGYKAFLALR